MLRVVKTNDEFVYSILCLVPLFQILTLESSLVVSDLLSWHISSHFTWHLLPFFFKNIENDGIFDTKRLLKIGSRVFIKEPNVDFDVILPFHLSKFFIKFFQCLFSIWWVVKIKTKIIKLFVLVHNRESCRKVKEHFQSSATLYKTWI